MLGCTFVMCNADGNSDSGFHTESVTTTFAYESKTIYIWLTLFYKLHKFSIVGDVFNDTKSQEFLSESLAFAPFKVSLVLI